MSKGVTIIAEAAQGFEGDPRLARLLIRAAHSGTADLVKFQLVFADELATPDYQHYALFKQLEMPDHDWQAVAAEASGRGIGLVFDVFGERSLDLALRLGARAVKLHATDFYNPPLVAAAFARAPHVFLSLGGIEYADVTALLSEPFVDQGRLTLMYGYQAEPTPLAQNHLARLTALARHFAGVRVGFMDHADGGADEGQWLGVLAVALGACAIEKHITLERGLELEDFVSALGPAEFARYAARIRQAEEALGSAALDLTDAEREYGRRAIKSVVAARDLPQGSLITGADVIGLRAPLPGAGTLLRQASLAVGRRTARRIPMGQPLCVEDLQ